jgi:hypothetical protein
MYDTIVADSDCVKTLMENAQSDSPTPYRGDLGTLFEAEEIYNAI